MKNFRPLGDRVLIKRIASKDRIGSILLPDQSKEKPSEGLVVAVGMGRIDMNGEIISVDVKPGQRVMFGKFVGSEVKLDGEEHVILREEDILGIVPDELSKVSK